ncbi:site-specific integrase [Kitasatospora xanthocidica]|uniref:tyrosine-type recombinase/integrase n=1 Tax=Kitasatospora xanthocidica TaxID=83382 RepID=UPI00216B538D|nr:site-specific integrase [Kitasatospora xanthocidica]
MKKTDAEAKRTEVETKLGSGEYRSRAAGFTKIADIAESWYGSRIDLRRSTRSRYREVLDSHILPRWGAVQVRSVRYEDIVEWVAGLYTGTANSGKPLSASSVRKIFVVLKGVLGFAVHTDKIPRNPAIGVPLPRCSPVEHVYLDNIQIETLADACGPYRVLILFLSYTGVRWGEVTAIQIKHVDLKAQRVRIAQAWGYENGRLYLEDSPKNHERRSVPVPKFLAKEIAPLIANRPLDDYLFTAMRGGVLKIRNFRSRHFKVAVTAAGLDGLGVTLHKLRHTAASLAIASGADVKVIQAMLGHKTAALTLDTYGHLWPDRLNEVSDRLGIQRDKALEKAGKAAKRANRTE